MMNWKELERGWRRELLSNATGNILDMGVGTGENFEFYQPGVKVTAVDPSLKVLEKVRLSSEKYKINTKFIASTIEGLMIEKHSFDTIVSAFSLSSYHDPGRVLAQYTNWCKPGGTILLLEYGLSRYPVVNWLQRKWEPYYYRKTGSHINRDILQLISGSGLEVKQLEVKYAGIIHLVWASLVCKTKKEVLI
jgi:ubiquinone/menaquinone biosynthesis C-methylase UbiE